LKVEEGMRFSQEFAGESNGESNRETTGESAGSLDEPHQEVLDLNQRIKTNENTRNWIARKPS
jgi:hypothetical protein